MVIKLENFMQTSVARLSNIITLFNHRILSTIKYGLSVYNDKSFIFVNYRFNK